MTETQRWMWGVWTGRLAMLCLVTMEYVETWRGGLLPLNVSLALFFASVALSGIHFVIGRPGLWWRRYRPLLTTAEKARMVALGPQRAVQIVLSLVVVGGCIPVNEFRDVLGPSRYVLLVGLLGALTVWFVLGVRLASAEWSVYGRIARDP